MDDNSDAKYLSHKPTKNSFFRFFIEKKPAYDAHSRLLTTEIKTNLNITALEKAKLLPLYDLQGFSATEAKTLCRLALSDKAQDKVLTEFGRREHFFAVEFLPGKYDERAASALQLAQLLFGFKHFRIKSGLLYILSGRLQHSDIAKIKAYYVNPLESRVKNLTISGFKQSVRREFTPTTIKLGKDLVKVKADLNLAMSLDSLKMIQRYFAKEKRAASESELYVLDAYWSDHCRHLTFARPIKKIDFITDGSDFSAGLKSRLEKILVEYRQDHKTINPATNHKSGSELTLMGLATTAAKLLHAQGKLPQLDISAENNACSFKVKLNIAGRIEPWLIMFKNETHNHPTEIEPFSGAQTCVGGVVRDPLSARGYVYQAIRLSGGADPRQKVVQTLPGKLPLKKLFQDSARGFSSYGNQIGIATSLVREVFHPGYRAKRLECGLAVGAAPLSHVVRAQPAPCDLIIIVGGKTGNDGLGGATGSSKPQSNLVAQDLTSEVQRGNAVMERKLQRLFRTKSVSRLIKRSNDCGAGGIAVAAGELAPGVLIRLDALPVKQQGLNARELALSESQERMLVVVNPDDAPKFITRAKKENLTAVVIGEITKEARLQITWQNRLYVDLDRKFLDSGGFIHSTAATIGLPFEPPLAAEPLPKNKSTDISARWLKELSKLENSSQQALGEMFDFSIGKATVLAPYGGKYQLTECEVSVVKTHPAGNLATAATFGFDPQLSAASPFHGAVWAVVDSAAKLIATGAELKNISLSFQEYFEKLDNDKSWGKPLAALLGAYWIQKRLSIAAIGGKDSMSGTYGQIKVPPTLISFAVASLAAETVVSPEFKKPNTNLYLFSPPLTADNLPETSALIKGFNLIHSLATTGKIFSAQALAGNSLALSLAKQAFGNMIGARLNSKISHSDDLFSSRYGAILLETEENLRSANFIKIGRTQRELKIDCSNGVSLPLAKMLGAWNKALTDLFPPPKAIKKQFYELPLKTPVPLVSKRKKFKIARPKALILVFPGTNCEYDTAQAFTEAGALVQEFVFINLSQADLNASIQQIVRQLQDSQILVIPGGFSLADEPAGAGKFIATLLLNVRIKEAIANFLSRDNLILGICNGFQALIKSGLVLNGTITGQKSTSPTLTFNASGRHVSRLVATKVLSDKSPWYQGCQGQYHKLAVSHSEGRFVISKPAYEKLLADHQIAEVYVDSSGKVATKYPDNPNGSDFSIEAITSPCGRVLGKMGHAERAGRELFKNVPGKYDLPIFKNGVNYFL